MGGFPEKPGRHAKAQRFQGIAAAEVTACEEKCDVHGASQSFPLHISCARMHVCGAWQHREAGNAGRVTGNVEMLVL